VGPLEALQKAIDTLLARVGMVVEILRGIRDVHLESRTDCEIFHEFGSVSIAAGATAQVLVVANPSRKPWATHDLGLEVDTTNWGVAGVSFSIRKNTSPVPGLGGIDFPWGSIAQRGRLKVTGGGAETLSIWATNASAVDEPVCAVVTGMFYGTVRGQGAGDDKVGG
jgi:hypothetical protein